MTKDIGAEIRQIEPNRYKVTSKDRLPDWKSQCLASTPTLSLKQDLRESILPVLHSVTLLSDYISDS